MSWIELALNFLDEIRDDCTSGSFLPPPRPLTTASGVKTSALRSVPLLSAAAAFSLVRYARLASAPRAALLLLPLLLLLSARRWV